MTVKFAVIESEKKDAKGKRRQKKSICIEGQELVVLGVLGGEVRTLDLN